MPATSKLNNFDATYKSIAKQAEKSIKQDLFDLINKYFSDLLSKQITPDGEALPLKKTSTIKAYNKKGYNTRQWMVRTGDSVKLLEQITTNGIKISPKGDNNLKYVAKSEDFYLLNKDIQNEILKKIKANINELS